MNTPYNSAMRVAVFNTAKLIVPKLNAYAQKV